MVVDTGIGVSDALKQRLWDPFKQASRWQSGTGLGLYHVKELATSLGGSVGYQSNVLEGTGSVFWVDIPYSPCADASAAEPSARSASGAEVLADGRPRLDVRDGIIIAEDNLFIQELTAQLVRSVGAKRVVLAANGIDCLSALTASDAPSFALVLMDVQVPPIRVCRGLKQKVGARPLCARAH